MDKKVVSLKILNIVTLIGTLIVNALSTLLPLNGKSTGALSDALPNLFVPSGITFSIWGVIYLFLIIFAVYQAVRGNGSNFLIKAGFSFIIVNVLNTAWIFLWHWQMVGLSLLVILGLYLVLLKLYMDLNSLEPFSGVRFAAVKTPFTLYTGWITIALIANVTAFLVDSGWNGFGLSQEIWAIGIIIIGFILASLFTLKYRDPVYACVIAWAFLGIYRKRSVEVKDVQTVGLTALILTIVMAGEAVFTGIKRIKQK